MVGMDSSKIWECLKGARPVGARPPYENRLKFQAAESIADSLPALPC